MSNVEAQPQNPDQSEFDRDLESLIAMLRAARIKIGPRELVAINRVAIRAIEAGCVKTVNDLRPWIIPIVAHNRNEQERAAEVFYARANSQNRSWVRGDDRTAPPQLPFAGGLMVWAKSNSSWLAVAVLVVPLFAYIGWHLLPPREEPIEYPKGETTFGKVPPPVTRPSHVETSEVADAANRIVAAARRFDGAPTMLELASQLNSSSRNVWSNEAYAFRLAELSRLPPYEPLNLLFDDFEGVVSLTRALMELEYRSAPYASDTLEQLLSTESFLPLVGPRTAAIVKKEDDPTLQPGQNTDFINSVVSEFGTVIALGVITEPGGGLGNLPEYADDFDVSSERAWNTLPTIPTDAAKLFGGDSPDAVDNFLRQVTIDQRKRLFAIMDRIQDTKSLQAAADTSATEVAVQSVGRSESTITSPARRSYLIPDQPWTGGGTEASRIPNWAAWVVALVPVVMLFWWLFDRVGLRKAYLRRRMGDTGAIRTELIANAPNFLGKKDDLDRTIARSMLTRERVPGRQIDAKQAIEATIRQGGQIFVPKFLNVQPTPEYLVLIERRSVGDQAAAAFRALMRKLEKLVHFEIWYFQSDVSYLSAERGGAVQTIEALASRFPEYRLLVFGRCDGLIDAKTGQARHGATSLLHWRRRALLTPNPVSEWGRREYQVARTLDMPIGRANRSGLSIVASLMALDRPRRELLDPYGDEANEAKPLHLSREGRSLVMPEAPAGAPPEVVIDELKRYLGRDGFQWLCALAVYPALQWDLTIFLGISLERTGPDRGEPLYSESLVGLLTELPWLQEGVMPGWLRRALIEAMPPSRHRQIAEIIRKLMPTNESSSRGLSDRVIFSVHEERIGAEAPIEDAIFLDFLARAELEDFEAPQEGWWDRWSAKRLLSNWDWHEWLALGLTAAACWGVLWLLPVGSTIFPALRWTALFLFLAGIFLVHIFTLPGPTGTLFGSLAPLMLGASFLLLGGTLFGALFEWRFGALPVVSVDTTWLYSVLGLAAAAVALALAKYLLDGWRYLAAWHAISVVSVIQSFFLSVATLLLSAIVWILSDAVAEPQSISWLLRVSGALAFAACPVLLRFFSNWYSRALPAPVSLTGALGLIGIAGWIAWMIGSISVTDTGASGYRVWTDSDGSIRYELRTNSGLLAATDGNGFAANSLSFTPLNGMTKALPPPESAVTAVHAQSADVFWIGLIDGGLIRYRAEDAGTELVPGRLESSVRFITSDGDTVRAIADDGHFVSYSAPIGTVPVQTVNRFDPDLNIDTALAMNPPWSRIANRELAFWSALNEQDERGRERIAEYFSATDLVISDSKGDLPPWGCAFIAWVIRESDLPVPARAARCDSWRDYGQTIAGPRAGALAFVESLPQTGSTGFVGIITNSDQDSITLLGGNVNNSVRIRRFARDRITEISWPTVGRPETISGQILGPAQVPRRGATEPDGDQRLKQ